MFKNKNTNDLVNLQKIGLKIVSLEALSINLKKERLTVRLTWQKTVLSL